MCRPTKPSRSRKSKVRRTRERLATLKQDKPKKQVVQKKIWRQTTLADSVECSSVENDIFLEASGDPLTDKPEGTLRIGLQNPNGITLTDLVDVLPEVEAISRLELDITALPETKSSKNGRTREVLQRQLNMRVGSSMVVEASAPRIRSNDNNYQPGGVMLTLTGKVTGRVNTIYSDPMGRFTYAKLQGSRDEGILMISAYRVCQKKGSISGPTTAFTQQIGAMLQEERLAAEQLQKEGRTIPKQNRRDLDPRKRLLADLKTLIATERSNGFRPILCMDANEDWTEPKHGKELKQFLLDTQLEDPLYEKFKGAGLTQSTYARGKRRIDFMFFDTSLVPAIQRIGTLGLHEAIISDHVMLYADLDENQLFQGLINRPVRIPSREFILAQAVHNKG